MSDYFERSILLETNTQDVAETCLKLASLSIQFANVKRVPRYTPDTRESDVEHSFMLGLIAQDVAATYFPELDTGLVAQLAPLHDLVEVKTNDIPTYTLNDEALRAKANAEAVALGELYTELPPATARLLRIYEAQEIPEARFVRLMDKIMPVLVDIIGCGSQIMHEDYDIHTRTELDQAENKLRQRFALMFPETELDLLHSVRNVLAQRFNEIFVPSHFVQDALF